jgi:hypothetical protein
MPAAHVNGSTRGPSFGGGRARRSVERAVRRYQPTFQPNITTTIICETKSLAREYSPSSSGPDTSPEFLLIKEEHNERSIL